MPQVSIYPDDEMLDKIMTAATQDGRTVSNMIVYLLSVALQGRADAAVPDLSELEIKYKQAANGGPPLTPEEGAALRKIWGM